MKTTKKTSNKNAKVINKDMTFAEILEKYPETGGVLFESGLHCIGCGGAMYETLEQGCMMHGFSKKQIDDLVKKLNGWVLLQKEHKMIVKERGK